ncbi:Twitching mobility protein [Aquicella siphonis]|uniref:Twitching mobility protein n=1 Tax=Aquicella siphonis TaxID=254247 RepID=A0A5E4PJN7_9COXI|nr:hypothetical protein [Aquicella siphonis]VVC76623.1 Twitching mobility protein [Aquicella siphonis]
MRQVIVNYKFISLAAWPAPAGLTEFSYDNKKSASTGKRPIDSASPLPAIRNLIREDKIAQMYSALQTSKEAGMQTMEKSIQELIKKKIIREEDALLSSFQREFFESF